MHRGEPPKPCPLRQAPTAQGAVRFWCSLPTADTSSFVPLELRVMNVSSGSPRYHRVIHINEVGECPVLAELVLRGVPNSTSLTARPNRSVPGRSRGAAGAGGGGARPSDPSLAPAAWSTHEEPHSLRGGRLYRQQPRGSAESEALRYSPFPKVLTRTPHIPVPSCPRPLRTRGTSALPRASNTPEPRVPDSET